MSGNKIFHEKQSWMLCGIHSLNNALQKKLFDKSQFDAICLRIDPNSFPNGYRSVFGLGNYDVNVLMEALKVEKYSLQWVNPKKDLLEFLNPEHIEAYIVNKFQPFKFLGFDLPISGRHWLSYRLISDCDQPGYYNLDSKLPNPEFISKDVKDFFQHFREMKSSDYQMFVIVTEEVANEGQWCNDAG